MLMFPYRVTFYLLRVIGSRKRSCLVIQILLVAAGLNSNFAGCEVPEIHILWDR